MRAIVRDTYGSPDILELSHQALGFRVQAYGVTQQKDLFTRRQLVALTTFASLRKEAHFCALSLPAMTSLRNPWEW